MVASRCEVVRSRPLQTANGVLSTQPTSYKGIYVVRSRIVLAEKQQWLQLIQALSTTQQAQRDKLLLNGGNHPSLKPETSATRKFELACDKIRGDCLRSASQILLGAGAPAPCPATTEATKSLFKCAPLHPPQQAALSNLVMRTLLPSNVHKHCRLIPTKCILHRLRLLRAGAQPGPSGTRNTHLKQLITVPEGAQALTAWVNTWAQGDWPAEISALFTKGWCDPLHKPKGGVRPILLFECSLKLATGAALHHYQPRFITKLFPEQFGLGLPAGADCMLRTAQCLADSLPNNVFVATDVSNAFGTLSRLFVLEQIIKTCPGLAPTLAVLWQHGPTVVWIHEGLGQWVCFAVHDGLFQGECCSTAFFCLAMKELFDTFRAECNLAHCTLHILAYIDDVLFTLPLHHLAIAWPIGQRTLANVGLTLNVDKCVAWQPSATTYLPAIASILPQSLMGLELMGSAVEDGISHHLGPFAAHSAPIQKRLEQALALHTQLKRMLCSHLACAVKQPVLVMTVRVLAHKFDFDARVSSQDILRPYAEQLSQLVSELCELVAGHTLSTHQHTQVTLPLDLGGLGVPNLTHLLSTAPLASYLQTRAFVVRWLASHQLPASFATSVNPLPAQTALGYLHNLHLDVTACGKACVRTPSIHEPTPAWATEALLHITTPANSSPLDLLAPPANDLTKVQGSLFRACNIITQLQLLHAMRDDLGACTRLRSAGGIGNGMWILRFCPHEHASLSDTQFGHGIAFRLGLTLLSSPQACCHQPQHKSTAPCGRPLDPLLHHAVTCPIGGGREILHSAVVNALFQCFRDCYLNPRREVHVPALSTNNAAGKHEDAILDVVAWGPGAPTFHIDVTIKHPNHLSSPACARTDGIAAASGDKVKFDRYPSQGGVTVTPASIETWGRMSPIFYDLLLRMSQLANEGNAAHGLPTCRHLPAWLTLCGTLLTQAISHNISSALSLDEDLHKHVRHVPGAHPPVSSSPTTASAPPGLAPPSGGSRTHNLHPSHADNPLTQAASPHRSRPAQALNLAAAAPHLEAPAADAPHPGAVAADAPHPPAAPVRPWQ